MTRLSQLIEEARGKPFAWGVHDCCTWVMSSLPPDLRAWRPPYRSGLAAMRQLRTCTDSLHLAGIATYHGLALISPARARRGDWLLMVAGRRERLALCLGRRAAAPGPAGLVWSDTLAARAAWSHPEPAWLLDPL